MATKLENNILTLNSMTLTGLSSGNIITTGGLSSSDYGYKTPNLTSGGSDGNLKKVTMPSGNWLGFYCYRSFKVPAYTCKEGLEFNVRMSSPSGEYCGGGGIFIRVS